MRRYAESDHTSRVVGDSRKHISLTISGKLLALLERTYERADNRPDNLNTITVHDFARKLLAERLVNYAKGIGEIDED